MMAGLTKKISRKAGLGPGSIVYVGDERTHEVGIHIMTFNQTELLEFETSTTDNCFPVHDGDSITWIDIDGIHNVDIIKKIGEHFKIHPLVLEDIVNTGQRPKFAESEDYLLFILKMKHWPPNSDHVITEQISLIAGKNYIISFQEMEGDVFDSVRERIRKIIPRNRLVSADYLAYSLMDAIIDSYYAVTERLGEEIESLEDELIERPQTEQLESVQTLRRELALMRKAIWPLREMIGAMERSESKLIHKETALYIRDLYDHAVQIIDTVETFRDMASGLMEIYLSSVSNKMNEVMKVLTIIATIFIPLGFLAGVYGMNFDRGVSPANMPELGFKYGYILFWAMTLLVGGGLLWFFKRKHWI
jgi:magnesium transporter